MIKIVTYRTTIRHPRYNKLFENLDFLVGFSFHDSNGIIILLITSRKGKKRHTSK